MYNFRYVPPSDPILGSGRLEIETLDENGATTFRLEIVAADVADEQQRSAIEHFAASVAEEQRKAGYLERWPLSEGEHNRYRIEGELREDRDDWHFRLRRDRDRYEGLGDEALSKWRTQR